MTTFVTVGDELISSRIRVAKLRVIYAAPAASKAAMTAISELVAREDQVWVTIILDSSEDPYRIGYGEYDGLKGIRELLVRANSRVIMRAQSGLRIGLLVTDDDVLIWSPEPVAVETPRKQGEPNGILLGSSVATHLAGILAAAGTGLPMSKAEVGSGNLDFRSVEQTLQALDASPPAPFDLSRVTRVFSTKFQYVETRLRGGEWVERKISISSLILNADVAEDLQDILESTIKPFARGETVEIAVQAMVAGQLAYDEDQIPIKVPTTQDQIHRYWKDLLGRFVVNLPGFGVLIRKSDRARFDESVHSFETVLRQWVEGFRAKVAADRSALIDQVSAMVIERAKRSKPKRGHTEAELKEAVAKGIERMRDIQPKVELVFKEISWESTRDAAFIEALKTVLHEEELKGWVEEFIAAPERKDEETSSQVAQP